MANDDNANGTGKHKALPPPPMTGFDREADTPREIPEAAYARRRSLRERISTPPPVQWLRVWWPVVVVVASIAAAGWYGSRWEDDIITITGAP